MPVFDDKHTNPAGECISLQSRIMFPRKVVLGDSVNNGSPALGKAASTQASPYLTISHGIIPLAKAPGWPMIRAYPKPHHIPSSKRERLLKRKAMTIALGLWANDGLVLCADTEKTISGYIKTYDGKIDEHLYNDPRIIVAIAGAGTEDYINTARGVLLEDLPEELKRRQGSLHHNIPALFKERLLNFFDEHLSRWAYFPEHERPTVELLIGVTGKGLYPRLFHYDGTSFHESRRKAIGQGVLLADQLLTQYGFGPYTVAQLSSLAVYVVHRVKKGVAGCGGSSYVTALRKGFDLAFTDDKEIKEMENRFEELDSTTNESVSKSIFDTPLSLSWHSEYRKGKPKS